MVVRSSHITSALRSLSIYERYIGDNYRYIGKMQKKPSEVLVCSTRWFPSILSSIYWYITNISAIFPDFSRIFPIFQLIMPISCSLFVPRVGSLQYCHRYIGTLPIYRRFFPIFPSTNYRMPISCRDGPTPEMSTIYQRYIRNISNIARQYILLSGIMKSDFMLRVL